MLHTAMRDCFDTPNQAKGAKEAADLEKTELAKYVVDACVRGVRVLHACHPRSRIA